MARASTGKQRSQQQPQKHKQKVKRQNKQHKGTPTSKKFHSTKVKELKKPPLRSIARSSAMRISRWKSIRPPTLNTASYRSPRRMAASSSLRKQNNEKALNPQIAHSISS